MKCVTVYNSFYFVVLLKMTAYTDDDLLRLTFKDMTTSYEKRKDQLESVCKMQTVTSHNKEFPPYPDIFQYYTKLKMAVCKLDKTGSVLIPKLVNILESKVIPGQGKFDLNSYNVNFEKYDMTMDVLQERRDTEVQYVMIGRNPYDRLLALYIAEVNMLSGFNRQIGMALRKQLDSVKVNRKTYNCGYQIGFQDFLQYILEQQMQYGFVNSNPWDPISRKCSPCSIKFNYIFRYDTLSNDIFQVLNSTNMSFVHRKIINKILLKDLDEDFIYIDTYVTKVISSQRNQRMECSNVMGLFYKLWEALQGQGLLHELSEFPWRAFSKITDQKSIAKDSIKIIRREMVNKVVSLEQRRAQRRNMYVLYDLVNEETLNKLRVVYKQDFLMFGYDPYHPLSSTVANPGGGRL